MPQIERYTSFGIGGKGNMRKEHTCFITIVLTLARPAIREQDCRDNTDRERTEAKNQYLGLSWGRLSEEVIHSSLGSQVKFNTAGSPVEVAK